MYIIKTPRTADLYQEQKIQLPREVGEYADAVSDTLYMLHAYAGEPVRFNSMDTPGITSVALFSDTDLALQVAKRFGGVLKVATMTQQRKGTEIPKLRFA